MIKKPKIAFFVVDGTLISLNTRKITDRMVKTLKALQDNGVKIVIASGRPPFLIPKFKGLKLDGYLAFNGSYTVVDGEVVSAHPMNHDDVARVTENAKRLGKAASAATAEIVGMNREPDENLNEYLAFSNGRRKVMEDYNTFIDQDIYQMMIGIEEKDRDRLLEGTTDTDVTVWWERAVDVIPAGSSKGEAVRNVLEKKGILPEEAAAFGDGGNDISMLEVCGTGVAMANGTEDVREAAGFICPPVDEDGIYAFCVENGWIEPLK